MSKPIEIKLDAETSGAEAGAGRVADALGGVEDALDQVTDAGKDNTRVLDDIADKSDDAATALDRAADASKDSARALDDVADKSTDAASGLDKVGDSARDVGQDADTLDRDFTKALDNIADEARTTGDDLGDRLRRGSREASDAVDDFKDESSSSMREAAASFDGSAESIQGVFQEISANALASFGPAGALAGLATAVGAGVLFNFLNAEAEKTKERLQEAFDDMVENVSGAFSQSFIEGQLANIFSGADEAVISLEKLTNVSNESGVAVELLARAYAGDMSAMEEATAQLQDKIADDSAVLGFEAAMSTATGSTLRDLEKQREDWDSTTSRVEGYNNAIDDIPSRKRTKVDVDDDGTARGTQRAINSIKGKDVPLHVYVPQASINDIYNTIAGIRLPALTVQARYGQAAV